MNQPARTPDSVVLHSRLADGSLACISASRRPRGGRADLKCHAAAAPALAPRMLQVARLARHTEASYDSREQVVISLDGLPGELERDWELAVVLADRAVRGLLRLPADCVANGWSDEWQYGRVHGHTVPVLAPGALLGGPGQLRYLGLLTGQPDVSAAVSCARAWFPLHSGGLHDALGWVEVSVYPLAQPAGETDDAISAPAQDGLRLAALQQVLVAARHFDGQTAARWRTTVRFSQNDFQGNSYELALVMADRLARGRECVPRGRIIASGCSSAWHVGRVDTVEALEPKCALIAREAGPGDRVLLPHAWQGALPVGLRDRLQAQGASLACIERIGMI